MRSKPDISLLSFKARPTNSSFFRATRARENPRCSPSLDAAAFRSTRSRAAKPSRNSFTSAVMRCRGENWSLFVELTISRSIHHLVTAARRDQLSFFDRGIIDQVSGLEHLGLQIPQHL